MENKVLEIACSIARLFEGFKSKPYKCPAGIWTIGFGTTRYPSGVRVSQVDKAVSISEAEVYLAYEMTQSLKGVVKYCPVLVNEVNRLAAITDFVYNLGLGNLQTSTLRKKLNQCDWSSSKKELMKWTHGGGRILPGLVKRREVEAKLL